jgi:hypothetical protein
MFKSKIIELCVLCVLKGVRQRVIPPIAAAYPDKSLNLIYPERWYGVTVQWRLTLRFRLR